MKKITTIIFDLGGVLLNINYKLTINAFEKLGMKNSSLFYSKQKQHNIFNKIETGEMSNDIFIKKIERKTKSATKKEILEAWNKMIMNLPQKRIDFIKHLKKRYTLFLLSNTNEIHISSFKKSIGEDKWIIFNNLFKKVYLSHEIGLRKPSKKVFNLILKENNITAAEVLFIDDSYQHIKTAKKLGFKTHHLKNDEDIITLFSGKSQLIHH